METIFATTNNLLSKYAHIANIKRKLDDLLEDDNCKKTDIDFSKVNAD